MGPTHLAGPPCRQGYVRRGPRSSFIAPHPPPPRPLEPGFAAGGRDTAVVLALRRRGRRVDVSEGRKGDETAEDMAF